MPTRLSHNGWQAGFYFFAFIAFIALAVVYFILPETHQHQHPLKITTIKKILLIISYYFSKSVIATSIVSAFMFLVCGLLVPMSIGKGLSIFRDMAGTATAVMYLVNISITGFMSYLVGFIHVVDLVHLMWIYMFLLSSIVVVYWLLLRR